nr:MAG TPA: hypothetical protein [Microviridae sp.]
MCAKQNPSYHLGFSHLLSINAQLTPLLPMVLSPQ